MFEHKQNKEPHEERYQKQYKQFSDSYHHFDINIDDLSEKLSLVASQKELLQDALRKITTDIHNFMVELKATPPGENMLKRIEKAEKDHDAAIGSLGILFSSGERRQSPIIKNLREEITNLFTEIKEFVTKNKQIYSSYDEEAAVVIHPMRKRL